MGDGRSRARGEGCGGRSRPRDAGLRRGAADGGGSCDGRAPNVVRSAARDAPQRLPRAGLVNAGRTDRPGDPQARARQPLPVLSGAGEDGGEGAGGGDPGSLHARRVEAGRADRPGRRHGRDGHLEEPGQPALRGDRRAGAGVPDAPARGGAALFPAGRHLHPGARRRPHRQPRGDTWTCTGAPVQRPSRSTAEGRGSGSGRDRRRRRSRRDNRRRRWRRSPRTRAD